jgi:hypothetical protein
MSRIAQKNHRRPLDRPERSWDRVKHTCLAWVEGEPQGAAHGLARTVDLSPSGAGLVLSRALEPKSQVVVELLLPGTLRLRASGEIVHCIPLEGGQFRVGVRFFSAPVLADVPRKEQS